MRSQTRALLFLSLFLMSVAGFQTSALATCTSPTGNAGDLMYNSPYHIVQYCNGGSWIPTAATGDVTSGLIHLWTFDNTVADSVGSANGALAGNATYATGIRGQALTLDGTGDYVDVTISNIPDISASITVAGWINLDPAEVDANIMGITRNASSAELDLDVQNACAHGMCVFQASTWGGGNLGNSARVWPYSAWHHFAYTYDSGTTMNTWYIDGAVTGTPAANAHNSGVPTSVRIGYSTAGGSYLYGLLDDVRMYNRALSATEVAQLYTSQAPSTGPTTGLVSWWKLDEGDYNVTTATDSIGGHDGTLTNFPASVTWSGGAVGGALTFASASSRYVEMNDQNSMEGLGAFSTSAWVKTSSAVEEHILDKSACNGVTGVFEFGVNIYPFFLRYTGASSYIATTSATAVNNNAWHHLVGVYNGTDVRMYIDGALDSAATAAASGTTVSNAQKVEMGGRCNGTAGLYWNGSIDDVRFYNVALTATEVSQLYSGGSAGTCGGPAGNEGDMLYNSASHVLQFCSGTNWVAMGTVPGTGGGGCSNPSGVEGNIMFNSAYSVMQYCDGTNWRLMGTLIAPTSGLVGWWTLDNTPNDSSVSAKNGTWSGGASYTTAQMGTFSGDFNNTRYVSIANAPYSFDASDAFTLSAWVYRTGTTDDDAILGKITAGAPWQGYLLGLPADGSCTVAGVGTADDCVEVALNTGAVATTLMTARGLISPNAWHNVTLTFSGNGDISGATVYIDGVSQALSPSSGAISGITNAVSLRIGDSGDGTSKFNGRIDDARVYSRALSATEVYNLYKATGG